MGWDRINRRTVLEGILAGNVISSAVSGTSEGAILQEANPEEVIEAYYNSRVEAFDEQTEMWIEEHSTSEVANLWVELFSTQSAAAREGRGDGISQARTLPDGLSVERNQINGQGFETLPVQILKGASPNALGTNYSLLDNQDEMPRDYIEAYYETRYQTFMDESAAMIDEQTGSDRADRWAELFDSPDMAAEAGRESAQLQAWAAPDGLYAEWDPDGDAVQIFRTNSPLNPGDVLKVTAGASNPGNIGVTSSVDLIIEGEIVDSEIVWSVGTHVVELEYEIPEKVDNGTRSIRVEYGNIADEQEIEVRGNSPVFDITINEVTDPVQPGTLFNLEANIELSETAVTADAEIPRAYLYVSGEEVDSEVVHLNEDWTATVALGDKTSAEVDEGVLPVRVEFLDAVDEDEIKVEGDPPLFDVSITDATDPVEPGELLEVETSIELSEATVTEDVADSEIPQAHLFIDGEEVDSEEVILDADWTATVNFVHEIPADNQEGSRSIRVEFLEAEDRVQIEVRSDGELERIRPPDSEITVQPGTRIMFEVEALEPNEWNSPVWYLDGETAGLSMGPWENAYLGHQDAYYWQHTFESGAQVTADIDPDDNDESYMTTWTVDIDSDGIEPPTITDARPSTNEVIERTVGETIELELDVADNDETLDRVVWWAGAIDIVLDISTIEGATDTATLSVEADEIVPEGVLAWVIDENGAIVASDGWRFSRLNRSTFEITDLHTNSPVSGGEMLEVNTTIQNVGDETDTADVELIVGDDPEREDAETVTLDPDESTDLTLTFQTGQPAGDSVEFPIEVDTGTDTVSGLVVVNSDESTPATFHVMDMATNSPISGGETLEVDATIQNIGDETGTTDIELIVGDDPAVEDSAMLTLDPGESSTLTLTFQAGQPTGGVEEFPVRVDTGADTASEMIVVEEQTPATFNVMNITTNSPIRGGELLEVDAMIQNVGDESGTTDIELIVGDDPVVEDSTMLTLDPGESTTLTLTFQSGQPAGDSAEFPVVVDTGADTASVVVVVESDESTPATFNVMNITTNSPISGGETLEVTTTIQNVGDETGTTDIELIVGNDPVVEDTAMLTLDPGESATLTLTFQSGQPSGQSAEFPVEVNTGADAASQMVTVTAE